MNKTNSFWATFIYGARSTSYSYLCLLNCWKNSQIRIQTFKEKLLFGPRSTTEYYNWGSCMVWMSAKLFCCYYCPHKAYISVKPEHVWQFGIAEAFAIHHYTGTAKYWCAAFSCFPSFLGVWASVSPLMWLPLLCCVALSDAQHQFSRWRGYPCYFKKTLCPCVNSCLTTLSTSIQHSPRCGLCSGPSLCACMRMYVPLVFG